MENKTKDSQIHATGGSVKKLLNTPTQCCPHTRAHSHYTIMLCTHLDGGTQGKTVRYAQAQTISHTHTWNTQTGTCTQTNTMAQRLLLKI